MGSSEQTSGDALTVRIDDRGRITLPKAVRERLRVLPGDELDVDVAEEEIRLRVERPRLTTVSSGRTEWGAEAFPDAGEAAFGRVDGRDRDGS
jgi:AbrB family looped-hinge helix DNA binding protein